MSAELFDIIGDVHGCLEELVELLERLRRRSSSPRTLVFVGDLVDRGPDTPGVLKVVMGKYASGEALCVAGNHDVKLLKKLRGRNVAMTHGLAESMEQLDRETARFRDDAAAFIEALPFQIALDSGRLVVAHAGLIERLHGRVSHEAHNFALYGDSTGERDEYGLPIRRNWAVHYRGKAAVVYGHTPVREPLWLHNTINIDTGCVFGGKLTALRYPERELVQVEAKRVYCPPPKPF